MNPKVFISHASEDKERFVLDFSIKLRENGVDAWLDKWEMLPGDSLVDKIFEEGIKEADSFIIILSNNSITKPWVKEELNASFIKRINKNSKIIPVVLDNCDVPECLQSTIWEKIDNTLDYQSSFNRILHSIYGVSDKPSIGKTPTYVNMKINDIQGLTRIDSIIFSEACQYIMSKEDNSISLSDIEFVLHEKNISNDVIQETLEVLDSRGYIKAFKALMGGIQHFIITVYGFEHFISSNIENYNEIVNTVCLKILNNSIKDTSRMQEETNFPRILINHIFKTLEQKSYIELKEPLTTLPTYNIINISVEFKRLFR